MELTHPEDPEEEKTPRTFSDLPQSWSTWWKHRLWIQKKTWTNVDNGRWTRIVVFTSNGKEWLGYAATLIHSDLKLEEVVLYDHSSSMSSWDSDMSIGAAFGALPFNMTSASKPEDEEDDEIMLLQRWPLD